MPTQQEEPEDQHEDQQVDELAQFLHEMVEKLGDDDPGTIYLKRDGQEVCEIDPEKTSAKSLEALAQLVYMAAATEASKIGGTSIYFVHMRGTTGRIPLKFEFEPEEGDGQERGLARYEGSGGMMQGGRGPMGRVPVEGWVEYAKLRDRHEEFLYDASIKERSEVFKLFKSTIAEQSETIRELQKERARERVMIEELTSAKHLRDLELEKMKKTEDRKDEALGLLKPWAHSISARLLGPKAIPKDVVPLLQQFEAVFSTFTQEQFAAMATEGTLQLTPRQRQELAGLFSTIMNLTEQAKAEKAKAEGHANGQGQA